MELEHCQLCRQERLNNVEMEEVTSSTEDEAQIHEDQST
jgi:hypothetical protein